MIRHHPGPELLLDYAAGSAPEAVSLIVACHVSRCAPCQADVRRCEAIGGALFATLELEPADEDRLLTAMLARLDDPDAAMEPRMPGRSIGAGSPVLAPLRPYLAQPLEALPWRKVGRLFEEFRLSLASTAATAKLMRIRAGAVMPVHTHRGHEYTLVLAGGYSDQGDHFLPGDFDARDASHRHQPVVDPDGECLALVVLDAPIKLTGMFGRILNPFLTT